MYSHNTNVFVLQSQLSYRVLLQFQFNTLKYLEIFSICTLVLCHSITTRA